MRARAAERLLPDTALIGLEGVAAARRRLTTRDAVRARHGRLARHQIPWLLQHSAWTAQRFAEADLPPERWWQLPPVGKREMMAHFDALNTVGVRLEEVLALAHEAEDTRDFTGTLTTAAGEVGVGLSTGTSGARGAFLVDREDRLRWAGTVLAALLRPFPWSLRTPQRVAFFLRADGTLYRTAASSRVQIDFHDILRPIEQLAAALTATDPTLVVGPPSVLRAVLEAGARARPEKVVSVAEVLEDGTRNVLEHGFEAPVVQIYQATEGMLGLPCASGELHLAEEHVHVETEPLGGGLVRPVLTDLRRRAQPVIRHRLDDVLDLAPDCSCGSATRRIRRIIGRQDDALELPGPGGAQITIWPDFVRGALSDVPGLEEYRVLQTGPAMLRVETAPSSERIRAEVRERIGRALRRQGVLWDLVTIDEHAWRPAPAGTKLRRVLRTGR